MTQFPKLRKALDKMLEGFDELDDALSEMEDAYPQAHEFVSEQKQRIQEVMDEGFTDTLEWAIEDVYHDDDSLMERVEDEGWI